MKNIKCSLIIRSYLFFIFCCCVIFIRGKDFGDPKKLREFVNNLFDNEMKKEISLIGNELTLSQNINDGKENIYENNANNYNNSYEKENLEKKNFNIANNRFIQRKSENENFSFRDKNISEEIQGSEKKKSTSSKDIEKRSLFDNIYTNFLQKHSTISNIDTNIIGDWLKITSPEFFNSIRTPESFSKNKNLRIKLNSEEFRINDAFDTQEINSENFPQRSEYFWFRLIENSFLYSKTKTDLNIIGSIQFIKVSKYASFCICVEDNCKMQWSVCAETKLIINKFYCAMKNYLKEKSIECIDPEEITLIRKKVYQPIIVVPIPTRKCNEKWNYLNNGRDWECICAEGKQQSPIDLPAKSEAIDSAVSPLFKYREVDNIMNYSTLDSLLTAGNTVKIRFFKNAVRILHNDLGHITTLDGAVYIAEEIVFHVPSEHTIEGKRYDMEMQVIHYGRTKGDIAKQVVLSFLFEKSAGIYNRFIEDIDFYSLPNNLNKESDLMKNLFIPNILYTSDDPTYEPVLKPFSFYTYQGSLTFPPCTERTINYVASEPIPIGNLFIQLMKEALRELPASRYNLVGESLSISGENNNNNRDIQGLNGRDVFFFDHTKHCLPYKPCKDKEEEKIVIIVKPPSKKDPFEDKPQNNSKIYALESK